MIPGINASVSRATAAYHPSFADVGFLSSFDGADLATTAVDDSKYGQTISFINQARLDAVTKKFGSASLYLDGSNDYCSVPDQPEIGIGGNLQWTAECWFRPTAGALAKSIALLLNKRDGGGAEEFWLGVGSDQVRFSTFSGGSTKVDIRGGTCVAGTWHHVAAMRDGSDYYLFLDGVLVGSENNTGPSSNSGPLLIGRDGFSTGREFEGHIDEVRISVGAFYPIAGFPLPSAPFPRS